MSMSKETSNTQFSAHRNAESNENNGQETTPFNPTLCFPPPRTPLNAIADPAQTLAHNELLFDSHSKLEAFRGSSLRFSLSERKLERVPRPAGSEPSSAQSTPSRTGHRASLGGANCASSSSANVARALQVSSRVARAISVVNSEFSVVESPRHFELQEDSSFWADHNVQVLIRIRPPSALERIAQGYNRCLRQESGHSLMWLGHPETRFTFDHVACETISQESLFRVAGLPMVENCLSGYNSCMFAYGQTGSGKTYTMMGEIYEIEGKLNEDCGLTPRIFEYLFKRIMAEEENRRDERLKYSCKCSFLEIYNEQITDLLEPSSNNLQLREDLKKGVYVENLTEYIVTNVNDVVQLLLQGAANRKVAATHMNSESSRSHSVFTCTVESRWGKDSMAHFRFARLNLVDLAGSERQKSSGAEGERLKEAANINKSLSTLGLVIMSLVDLAHGKHRHVPYRDSRLTFLLQDSLGGNSKTTIIANISPSMCASNETLSTLKFAQRAKLIQNNAKVNEDTSGDVNALQRQIQELKGQLSFLMKHGYLPRSLPSCMSSPGESRFNDLPEEYGILGTMTKSDNHVIQHVQNKIKFMEATLAGALRREKMAESALQKLEAELEHTNCLACEKEEEAQHAKMMLHFRDEEIKRLESLKDGSLSAESYLVQENKALLEEIHLLRAGMDRKPESNQYALENNRLREQLQQFQSFYELGEREILLAEVSELRNQLSDMLEGRAMFSTNNASQQNDPTKELEECKVMNSKLIREVEELQMELRKNLNLSQMASGSVTESFSKDSEVFRMVDECSLFENRSMQSDAGDEVTSYIQINDEVLHNHMEKDVDGAPIISSNVTEDEFMDVAGSLIEVESEHDHVDNERSTQEKSFSYMGNSSNRDVLEEQPILKPENRFTEIGNLDRLNHGLVTEGSNEIDRRVLQANLDRMTKDLEEVRLLNSRFQEEQELQLSCQQEAELVREQVEMETARTILQLQEEVAALQCNLDEKLGYMTEENTKLRKIIATKEEAVKALNMEWERATLELTGFLVDGSRSLKNVSSQIESIACSFPRANVWINEHVERAARIFIEKEETILQLKRSLEDTQSMVIDMGQKLSSLKGATMALTELQNLDDDQISKEHTSMLLSDEIRMENMLEKKLKLEEARAVEAEKRASVALIVMNWLFDKKMVKQIEPESNIPISAPHRVPNCNISEAKADRNVLALEDAMVQVKLAMLGVAESENTTNAFYADTDTYIAALQTTVRDIIFGSKGSIQNLVKEIYDIKEKYMELRDQQKNNECCTSVTVSLEAHKHKKQEDLYQVLHQLRDEISKTNCRLKVIEDFVRAEVNVYECSSAYGVAWSPNCSSSSSDFSIGSVASGNMVDASSFTAWHISPEKISEHMDQKFEDPKLSSHHESSENPYTPFKSVSSSNTILKKELEVLFDAFNMLHVRLSALVNELNSRHFSDQEDLKQVIPSSDLTLEKANLGSSNSGKGDQDDKIEHARSFLKKFEEVHETVKEADSMLNALVQANENSKQLSGMWKRNGEELMTERANLIEEIEHLKSSLCAKENENHLLNDEASCSLQEVGSSISLLEESYQLLKSDEEKLTTIFSDVFSMGTEIVSLISSTRSFLEDIRFKIVEKDFCSFVMYQSYLEQVINKVPHQDAEPGFYLFEHVNRLQNSWSNSGNKIINTDTKTVEDRIQGQENDNLRSHMSLSNDDLMYENLALKKELKRKEELLDGLLFDFSLLQESTSITKDIKDETEKLVRTLSQVRYELEEKTRQVDELQVQHKKLVCHLADTEEALVISNANIAHANETIETVSGQNSELKVLVKDLYVKKSEVEEQLDEQKEIVKSLEEEILQLSSSTEQKFLLLVEDIEDNLIKVTSERDQLKEDIQLLKDKLEMAYTIVDEKEAIIVEAHQESKESKIYAEQKEEEVKILEHSIEELESTVNVLENKVYEMDAEVVRHRLIRDSLELELKALRQRLLTVENLTENVDTENKDVEYPENQISWPLQNKDIELHQAYTQIKLLKEERAEQDNEIKQYKEYINELMLHAEAQASQYQQKYKTLEAMVREVKTDSLNSTSAVPTSDKTEKSLVKARGSSSPFRCIGGFVQQANLERERELSAAKLRIEELETLAASRQKEVCMLNTRLAAAESMTHDVIRDLLGVKLDVTNFANMIDEYQVKKLMEEALEQTEDILEKDQEVVNLRKQLNDVIEGRERCVLEINRREGDLLNAQIAVEQLQERDRLLSAQNEMLKMDKSNLLKKIAELDEMVKALLGPKSTQVQTCQTSLSKNSMRIGNVDFAKRLEQSEKLLSRVNGELAQYYKSSRDRTSGHGLGTSYRKQKGQAG